MNKKRAGNWEKNQWIKWMENSEYKRLREWKEKRVKKEEKKRFEENTIKKNTPTPKSQSTKNLSLLISLSVFPTCVWVENCFSEINFMVHRFLRYFEWSTRQNRSTLYNLSYWQLFEWWVFEGIFVLLMIRLVNLSKITFDIVLWL